MIIFLLPEASSTGGTFNKNLSLINYLEEEAKIIIYSKKNLQNFNEKVLHTEEKSLIKNIFFLNSYIQKNNVEIIFCHFLRCHIMAFILKLLNPRLKIIRAFVGITDLNFFKRMIESITSNFFDSFIFVSDYVLAKRKPFMIDRKKINKVANGIVLNEKRCLSHCDKKDLKLLCIKGLTKDMDIDTLINCVANFSKDKNLTLHIIGDGPFRKQLEKQINSSGAEEKIKILGYVRNASEIIRKYDVYVHPTRKEGFGIAILEAMNSGIPTIVPNVGGASEIVKHQHNGLAIDFCEKKEWDKAIEDLSEISIRKKLVSNAHIAIKEKYSIEVMARNYKKIISNVNYGKN